MAKRRNPTPSLIREACSGQSGRTSLLRAAYSGLMETNLVGFYADLNLDETLMFAASSWASRIQRDDHGFETALADGREIYDIFKAALERGVDWFASNRRVSTSNQTLYGELNPFDAKTLRGRLERVSSTQVEAMIRRLQKSPNQYVFEDEYHAKKHAAGGNNAGLVLVRSRTARPKTPEKVQTFSSLIARIIKRFPSDYDPLEDKAPAKSVEPFEETLFN